MRTNGYSTSERRTHYANHTPQGRTCSRCIMDDTDPEITFNASGVCSHCEYADARLKKELRNETGAEQLLDSRMEEVRKQGQGKDYDCVIGISGGVDSSYVAWICKKKYGLRPLAVHLDNGWNSELAVKNIEGLLKGLDIDLFTHVIDWEEMRDLQRSMLLSGTANLEVITDHAINALLFRTAAKHGINTIITGANVATESMHLRYWHYDNRDWRFIKDIHNKHGEVPLKTFPSMSFYRFLWYLFGKNIRTIPVLNFIDYKKEEAKEFLNKEFGWNPYAVKHGESIFTHFLQHIYLPQKFGFDKRKLHYSSLIASGQITRDEALQNMNKPLYASKHEEGAELEYVLKKLGVSQQEWENIVSGPKKYYFDFKNTSWALNYDLKIVQYVRKRAKSE